MTRRAGLWATGIATLALLVVLAVLDERLMRTGGPGIVPFEVAGDLSRSREILAAWGETGRETAQLSLWLDFAFLAAYGAFLALATAAVRCLARGRGWRWLAPPRWLTVPLPLLAAGFDAVENVFLLVTLGEGGGAAAPRLALIFATGKFVLFGATLLYILAVLARATASKLRAASGTTPRA